MKVGLIGMPQVGKSALFHLLTGHPVHPDRQKAPIGTASVPDRRIDRLAALYSPEKTTYATLTVTETPGFSPAADGSGAGNSGVVDIKGLVDSLRDVDAVVHVVRAFTDPTVPHLYPDIDPDRDLRTLTTELILTDWQLAQTRIERLRQAKKRGPNHDAEFSAMEKISAALEDERPIFAAALTPQEEEALQGYAFFTSKPVIIGLNVDEERLGEEPPAAFSASAAKIEAPIVSFSARVEAEIADLDRADRTAFMEALGIEESGVERLARAVYERLGRISYFTVGEDEVRAWTIKRGASAKEAAGAIHSDISRGFIRAEVASYDELVLAGGWSALKTKGRVRLEGRDYIVQDGDVMSFRFNV